MLKKDLMRLCMLHLLSGGDRYGYEMLSLLHSTFPDTQESAIYAVLRELNKEILTYTYFGDTSGGPARKYYKITEKGREEYLALMEQWRALKEGLEALGIQ